MIKKIYALWLFILTTTLGVDFAKRFDAYLRFKRKLNLKNPRTLADKVSYLFLHKSTLLMSQCTDKWAVREYIAKKGLADILIPTVGGPWNSVEKIDFNALPNTFILKATHGCAMNLLVWDKTQLDIKACKMRLRTWLNTTYGTYSVEPHYQSIMPRIYAEKLLENGKKLIDYKIHCLNGKPEFILVCSDRDSSQRHMSVKFNLFDTKWNNLSQYLQTSGFEIPNLHTIPQPQQLNQMLSVASDLSVDFPFVRVDLYEVNGRIYFGELTFSPACGVFPYFTDEFIEKMGKELILSGKTNEK